MKSIGAAFFDRVPFLTSTRNKLEELKLLIHDTHADITIQETKLTPKAKTPKIHNFTSVRTDRLHKAGGGLITLITHIHYNRQTLIGITGTIHTLFGRPYMVYPTEHHHTH